MIECPSRTGENPETILAYLDGRLPREKAVLLERHFEQCIACREALRARQAVWDALDEWEPEPVSADFDRRLYRRIEQEEDRAWWRQLFRPVLPFSLRPALAVATFCLVLVAGVLMRAPVPNISPAIASADSVDIEQVEQAVEDLEMLYVLDPEPSAGSAAPAAPVQKGAGLFWLPDEVIRCV